jgi:predicted AAA+ superfamily ATPase
MSLIIRQTYLKKLIDLKDNHYIKVITGVRRCGKSTLLEQYKTYLIKTGISTEQIISYDFNDIKLAQMNYEVLHDEIIKKAVPNKVSYLFLDEIQEIDKFEKCVISLFENKLIKFDICIAGSNSKMFSEQLATLFTGRNLEIKVLPFSFMEFLEYYKENSMDSDYSIKKVFEIYMKYGGLPILLESLENDEYKEEKLSKILSDTIQKDIKTRHAIKNVNEFNRIARFVLSESGKEISATKTANYLRTNEKSKISNITVGKYLDYLQQALLLYKADLFNIQGRRLLKTTAKYYAVDSGIKNVQNKFNS